MVAAVGFPLERKCAEKPGLRDWGKRGSGKEGRRYTRRKGAVFRNPPWEAVAARECETQIKGGHPKLGSQFGFRSR